MHLSRVAFHEICDKVGHASICNHGIAIFVFPEIDITKPQDSRQGFKDGILLRRRETDDLHSSLSVSSVEFEMDEADERLLKVGDIVDTPYIQTATFADVRVGLRAL